MAAAATWRTQTTGGGGLGGNNYNIGHPVQKTWPVAQALNQPGASIGIAAFVKVWDAAADLPASFNKFVFNNLDPDNYVDISLITATLQVTIRVEPNDSFTLGSDQVYINPANTTSAVSSETVVKIEARANTAACLCSWTITET